MRRTIAITGAAGGIGRALCPMLAALGDRLILIDRAESGVAALAQEIGGDAVAVGGTPLSVDACESALDRGEGPIHGLVHLAGTFEPDPELGRTPEIWQRTMQNNIENAYNFATALEPRLPEGEMGRLVFISSLAFRRGGVHHAAYSAAKGGIATLTLVQAAELGRYGVTANALCPAARTRMTEGVFTEMMATPDHADAFDAMAPENVSPLVTWLASSESAHVTGRMFEVEGGKVGIATGWQHGPTVDKGDRWDAAELGPVLDDLLARAPAPAPVYGSA